MLSYAVSFASTSVFFSKGEGKWVSCCHLHIVYLQMGFVIVVYVVVIVVV